jgi:hypothetical protein
MPSATPSSWAQDAQTVNPNTAKLAAAPFKFGEFEAPIPGLEKVTIDSLASQRRPITTLVALIVNYVTAGIIVMSLMAIVVGGYLYMTAGGSSESVGHAKAWVFSAVIGIVLALAAWIILNTINPQITNTTI